jgi:hypothetical protein
MDRTQLLRAFNEHFEEFIQDILQVFPSDTELRTVANALAMVRKANPRLTVIVFMERIVKPYKDQIETGDHDFFVHKDWKNDISDSTDFAMNKATIVDKIDRMRSSVQNMNDEDKGKSMQYIQNLTRLGEMYLSCTKSG